MAAKGLKYSFTEQTIAKSEHKQTDQQKNKRKPIKRIKFCVVLQKQLMHKVVVIILEFLKKNLSDLGFCFSFCYKMKEFWATFKQESGGA